jgi:hypothetical protein
MIFSKKQRRDLSYHKIWVQHHGPIPTDKDGRKMEIHHIDGDKNNNDISNLQLVTIQEHFDIHYQQKDYGACYLIAVRMKKSTTEISELARQAQLKKVNDGTHHLLGSRVNAERIANGTHHWLDGTKSSETQRRMIVNGSHRFVDSSWQKENQLRLVNAGKHNFVGGEIQKRRIEDGTHHFLTNNPGKFYWACEYCGHDGHGKTNYLRWHGNNCKRKKTP